MKVTVKTKVNIDKKVIEALEVTAKKNALKKTAEWVLNEITEAGVVPKAIGTLEQSGFVKVISDEIVMIVFDTPYARRWYFNTEGATFNTEYNENATDHWMDDFIHGDRRSELIDKFKEYYIEEAGGLSK